MLLKDDQGQERVNCDDRFIFDCIVALCITLSLITLYALHPFYQKETMSLKTWTCLVDNKAFVVTADDVTVARALLLKEGAEVFNHDLTPLPTSHRYVRGMFFETESPVEVKSKADKDLQETFDAACEALADLEEVLKEYTKEIATFNGTGLQGTNATAKLKFAKAILAIQKGVK